MVVTHPDALAYHDSEEVRAYIESTTGWQDMISSAVKYLRVACPHNVNARNTITLHLDDVLDWLNQAFVKSWSARNGLDKENRFLSLLRTLAPEFYDNAHVYQHGAYNSAGHRNTRKWKILGHALCHSSRNTWTPSALTGLTLMSCRCVSV